jgi:hypothetical protein
MVASFDFLSGFRRGSGGQKFFFALSLGVAFGFMSAYFLLSVSQGGDFLMLGNRYPEDGLVRHDPHDHRDSDNMMDGPNMEVGSHGNDEEFHHG